MLCATEVAVQPPKQGESQDTNHNETCHRSYRKGDFSVDHPKYENRDHDLKRDDTQNDAT